MIILLIEKIAVKRFVSNYEKQSLEEPFKVRFKDNEELRCGEGEPKFTIVINETIDKKSLIKNTSLTLGEAYMDGILDVEGDFYKALDLIMSKKNEFLLETDKLTKIKNTSKKKQKEEVTSHYNIGNDFYKLWLDDTMNYSCAYFKNPDDTLNQAQSNKINHIIDKLQLEEGMSLLDIGCGWGNLLITAAKKHKIKGLGITLSEEQHKEFKARIKKEELEDYIEVKLMDYRDLEKSGYFFDRIVSVGMMEHVGRENYDLFLENINTVLKDKGVILLHFISGLQEGENDPWMNKYIFPGGVIPSLREVINLSSEKNFRIIDIESLRRHYFKTLLCWHDNFNKEIDTINKMFDKRFIRMWRLYLVSCAANFKNGGIDLHQIIFSKGINNDLPMTRSYLYE